MGKSGKTELIKSDVTARAQPFTVKEGLGEIKLDEPADGRKTGLAAVGQARKAVSVTHCGLWVRPPQTQRRQNVAKHTLTIRPNHAWRAWCHLQADTTAIVILLIQSVLKLVNPRTFS